MLPFFPQALVHGVGKGIVDTGKRACDVMIKLVGDWRI